MNLDTLTLTPDELEELSRPYGPEDSIMAFKLGFAMALSEAGLTPEEGEEMLKNANTIFNPVEAASHLGEGGIQLATLLTAAGALGGAYTGYARANVDRLIDGKDDPEAVAMQKKLEAYRNMSSDLKRTTSLQPPIAG